VVEFKVYCHLTGELSNPAGLVAAGASIGKRGQEVVCVCGPMFRDHLFLLVDVAEAKGGA
jgi:hypothetical protein